MGSRRWLLLSTVSMGLLLITLDNSILYTALPTLISELGASNAQSLWIINAYPMVMAGLLLGSGTLGDRIGHRVMFLSGLVIFGLASLVAAFSPNPSMLIAARAFLAVGAAAMMPATLALIRIAFTDERERNFAIAIWGSISILGAALGPIIGGTLLEFFWWGSVFLINIPIVVIAFIAISIINPPNTADTSKRWDAISSIQVMAGLVASVFALKELAKTEISTFAFLVAVVTAILGFTMFVRRQRTLSYPLVDFSIFRNPAFSAGVAAAAFSMFAIAGMQLVSTQRFQLVMEYTPLQSGLIVSAVAIGSLPTALVAGAYLHRIGLFALISGGLCLSVIGALWVWLAVDAALIWTVLGLAITGSGLGAAMGVASTAIIGNAPVSRAGMAASIEEVSYESGSLIAVALLGSLLTIGYTRSIELPVGAPGGAGESLTIALRLAGDKPEVISAAISAFESGYSLVMAVVIVVLTLGTAMTGWLLRKYLPGSQSSIYSH